MQKEHVMYALTGLATDAYMDGFNALGDTLVALSAAGNLCTRLAELISESDEDELVLALIEARLRASRGARV